MLRALFIYLFILCVSCYVCLFVFLAMQEDGCYSRDGESGDEGLAYRPNAGQGTGEYADDMSRQVRAHL